jgi:propionyl-CoA carboxylase beta chain
MKELIQKVADEGDFFEIGKDFGKNILTGFGRIEGTTVGFVANQPMVPGRGARYQLVEARPRASCGSAIAFNIPIVTFVDVPGFLPGTEAGIRRPHQARRQAAVRLCRSDRAEGHRHHPQGLWRRL